MGNCIVLEKKVIKIIKTDGEVLEYKAPMKVNEVLSNYGGHAISDALPAIQYLHKDAHMVGGRIYYLLPLSVVPPQTPKKKVKFADPVVDAGQGSTGVVRIKLVISKQELRALVQKGGIAVDDMIPEFQKEEKMNGTGSFGPDCEMNATGWKPALESIPERN